MVHKLVSHGPPLSLGELAKWDQLRLGLLVLVRGADASVESDAHDGPCHAKCRRIAANSPSTRSTFSFSMLNLSGEAAAGPAGAAGLMPFVVGCADAFGNAPRRFRSDTAASSVSPTWRCQSTSNVV